jgi:hypothetical protein
MDMKIARLSITLLTLITLGLAVTSSSGAAKDIPAVLPKPDGKAPDTTKPIKVFILSGQSNMCGMGNIARSLTPLVKDKKKFQNLVDDKGEWITRKDAFYLYNLKKPNDKACPLSVDANGRNVGPELQIGHIMGYMHDEVVLVIKACCGNRALGYSVLPPSMRKGKFSDPKWPLGCEYDKWFCQYTQKMLKNLDKVLPGYKGQGYEIAGFGWWQGHKDINNAEWNRDYEKNLVALIKDMRAEFKAPKAPFVVATIAFGGKNMSGNALKILKAQLAVSDAKTYPEFAGNVSSVDCRDFYRGGGAHYGNNAETYMLVGDGMGRALAKLIAAKNKKTAPRSARPASAAPKKLTTSKKPRSARVVELGRARSNARGSTVTLLVAIIE